MIHLILPVLFFISTGFTYLYTWYAKHKNWLDTPNARSSHTRIIPNSGGIVFILLWIIASVITVLFHVITWQQALILLPGTLIILMTGFFDDRYNLSARWRLLFYFVAAIISVIALGGFEYFKLNENFGISLGMFGSILAIIAIVWSTNLFNFMDGLDGIAATEALFLLSIGGFFMYETGAHEVALLIWMLAACVAGFLVWNKPAAKIFMGDAGSASLGFIVIVLALWGEKNYDIPALLWFILYGVFLTDATLTLVRRLFAGEAVHQAHRLHAYQRLQQSGYSHFKVLLIICSINIVLALLAFSGFYYRGYLFVFALIAFAVVLGFYVWIERVRPMYPKA